MIFDPDTKRRLFELADLTVFDAGPMPADMLEKNLPNADILIGQTVNLYSEVFIDMAQYRAPGSGWVTLQGFPKGSSGCIGIQADGFHLDGSPFREVIVVSFLVAP